MRMHTSLRAAVAGLAIISTASAVQLASFAPRIEISNAQCRAAYTTNIDGCQATDFASGAKCSSACVQGLVKIGEVVNRVCKDVDVGETSIIGVFQNGIGIQALCPGVAVTTISSSTKAPTQTSAAAQPPARTTTTSAAAPPPPASTLATSTSTSQSEAAQAPSSSSQVIVTDPDPTSVANSPPTSAVKPLSSSSAAASPSRAANAQLSNADSGGGSPFDVQAVSASPRLSSFDASAAALLGVALLFVACA
ncbi:hypothetical protein BKA63DRAFT_108030 [Paraphoma chrysanthemicola]|nr:hypothetical protein BKA63DRAFT_108030 [Paraphoma chrysanthemicola]